jgi:hypothetical protein
MDQTSRSGNIAELPLCPLLVGYTDSPKVYAPIRVLDPEPAYVPASRGRPRGSKGRINDDSVAGRIVATYRGQTVRTVEIVRGLGLNNSTAAFALSRLAGAGLASRVRYGVWAVGV